jgi:hypothetical protein
MGEGYVDGVDASEDDGDGVGGDKDDDSDYSPKSKRDAGGRRRGPVTSATTPAKRTRKTRR